LQDTQISGTIPSSIGQLSQLISMWFENTQISGTIPSNFLNLSQLQYLNLASTQLNGCQCVNFSSMNIPTCNLDGISNCSCSYSPTVYPDLCNKNCIVSPWSGWTTTCQNGTQQRMRNITAYPFANGTPCPLLKDSQNCESKILSTGQIITIFLCFLVVGILFSIFGHFKLFVPSVTDEILPLVKDKDNEKKIITNEDEKMVFYYHDVVCSRVVLWCIWDFSFCWILLVGRNKLFVDWFYYC